MFIIPADGAPMTSEQVVNGYLWPTLSLRLLKLNDACETWPDTVVESMCITEHT